MLKKLRLEKGYTLKEVARFMGYKSKSGYWMLEQGKVKLTVDKIEKLSKLYNVSKEIFLK